MFSWLWNTLGYVMDKTWFNYSYWASDMFEHRMIDSLKSHRNEFLIDVFSTLLVSVVLALVITTIYVIIYKNKYNQKASKSSMLELAFFVGFVNFFKWEIITLLPLLLIIWCITYLKVQENRVILESVKKKIVPVYGIFIGCFIFFNYNTIANGN